MIGRKNVAAGLFMLAGFMLYGFVLVYLRDFAPERAAWIASYSTGTHFESRLAHVHGGLFALINIVIGVLLNRYALNPRSAQAVSWLALAGLLMPLGILAEVLAGVPPLLVLLGGISMLVATGWLGIAIVREGRRSAMAN